MIGQDMPATTAFGRWLVEQRNLGPAGFADPQALASVLSLAQARVQELRILMEQNPEAFLRQAVPEAERAKLPVALQPFIEKRIKARGFFGVYCRGLPRGNAVEPGHEHPPGGYGYEVQLNDVRYQAFVFGKWKNQTTVQEATIEGVILQDAIVLGDAPTPQEQAAAGEPIIASTPTTSGPNTLLYMIARFSDETSDPIDDATALSRMEVVSTFWLNNSSGTVSLKGLVNPDQVMDIVHIVLPHPKSFGPNYDKNFSRLLRDARDAASAQGHNYADYSLDAVITSNQGFSYAGFAFIGSQGTHWVTPYTTLRTAGHELGHNLGLFHANYWRTDSSSPFGKDSVPGGYVADSANSEWVEYGHYFSVMSAQLGGEWDDATKPHYNPVEKAALGWLSDGEIQSVTASGMYRLFRHDARNTAGNPRAIRIETPATDYTGSARRYWLGYRYAPWDTAQNWYQNGVELDVARTTYGADGSILLDMTPYSNDSASPFFDPNNKPGSWWTIDNEDKLDGALVVGNTYSDLNAGIHITPLGTGSNGTDEEYIDLAINLGQFADNHSPLISTFAATTDQAALDQTVDFSVAASDPDGDVLTYAWDFDQFQTWTASGLNSATATKSWSSGGQYLVRITVSDMKGGVTTESLIVTVRAPDNTNQLWGRVVWGGLPVSGARVWTAVGIAEYQTWTDGDGSYVLTNLASANPYTVSCAATGLTFTAQFPNPVSLASGNAFGKDFYANEPLPGGGGASMFTVSGRVTDAAIGVVGAEVRGGGMVTTTDASGNYQFTNFFDGTYILLPRKDSWTFSPSSRNATLNSSNSTGNDFSRVTPCSISGRIDGVPADSKSPAPDVYFSDGRSVRATRQGTGQNRYWGYTLSNVPDGQYSLVAELFGYSIVPAGFGNPLTVSGNLTNIDFNGVTAAVDGATSGRITDESLPLVGVTVEAKVAAVTIASAMSDSDGYYRIANLTNTSFTVSPTKIGYSFSPSSLSITSVPSGGNNFFAIGPNLPPTITSLTATPSAVVDADGTSTLTSVAGGNGTLTYSWDAVAAQTPVTFSVNDSSNAASTSVAFQSPGNYTFRVRVTDGNGLEAASNVSLVVNAGLRAMVVSPYEVQVGVGQTVAFRADAWDPLGNRTSVSPTWSASGGDSIDSNGVFSATTPGGPHAVTAIAGTSSATGFVWVTSTTNLFPPVITTQPVSLAVPLGSDAAFSVASSGTEPLSYQWLREGGVLNGATSSTYTLTNVQPDAAGNYSVQVSNAAGMMMSSNALLTVIEPPVITAQPISLAVAAGATATFSVVASGTMPLSYQWKRNDSDLLGATSDVYDKMNVQSLDAGAYTVVVSNGAGSDTSEAATLIVNNAPLLAAISNQMIHAGSTVTITNTVADLDIPPQTLTFSLDAGAPAGATIDATNGVFIWSSTGDLTGTTNAVTVRVDDDGAPSLSDTRSFFISVVAPLTIESIIFSDVSIAITWSAIPDRTYRVQYKDNLVDNDWSVLAPDVTAAGSSASTTESIGPHQRFYRVLLLDN